jgi:hypothetical protein
MAAVFNRRASQLLDAKLALVSQSPEPGESPPRHRDSQMLGGVTVSDSVADEFTGHSLYDNVGTRDLATLAMLTEDSIVEELQKRSVSADNPSSFAASIGGHARSRSLDILAYIAVLSGIVVSSFGAVWTSVSKCSSVFA